MDQTAAVFWPLLQKLDRACEIDNLLHKVGSRLDEDGAADAVTFIRSSKLSNGYGAVKKPPLGSSATIAECVVSPMTFKMARAPPAANCPRARMPTWLCSALDRTDC
ncbi:hypothetical protein [Mesorhizobium temperatum]|uniref:hypothetical protein n=1 Tax=Mesorhizobium temperatum TaxID=241416 RepID=UPI00142D9AA3|nr:hypothetical protein [Mesorhizobium temperatum]